jgi:hypothetical protein
MSIRTPLLSLLALAVLALESQAQLLVAEIARLDLSVYTAQDPGGVTFGPFSGGGFNRVVTNEHPSYIGTNPSAVAWNGLDLWVAGFNGNTVSQSVAIVRVPSAFQQTAGLTSLELAFGRQSTTPTQRGYSGLDLRQGYLFAAYDPGAVHPQGITAWTQGGKLRWAKSARGSCGVGFDPGFLPGSGSGTGCGFLAFGANGRALQDTVTGADLFSTGSGMSLLNSQGTFWRDIDFDATSGDAWVREGNNVLRGVRSGPNSISSVQLVVDVPDADFVIGQNIAFCDRSEGSVVVYNDRGFNFSTSEPFTQAIQFRRPDGSSPQVAFFGNPQPDGSGYYDFAWDRATGTLVILDFTNRQATLYALGGTP